MDAVESGMAKSEAAVWVNLIATRCRRLNPRRYGSSVAAVAIEQSRTEQKIGAEQSRFFGLNERNLLTG
jgi:hypothetical protein